MVGDYIPHTGNMLLVDNVVSFCRDGMLCGLGRRKIKKNEYWAKGHFKGNPVMPATAMIETMAQTAGCSFVMTKQEYRGKKFFLAGVEKAMFKHPLTIGDNIVIDARMHKSKLGFIKCDCRINKDNIVCATATITLWGEK